MVTFYCKCTRVLTLPDFWQAPAPDLAAFWAAHPQWYVRLGIKLLVERDKGPASAVSGYIDLLPKPDECGQFPVEWSDAEIAQLRYDKVESSIARQRDKWRIIQAHMLKSTLYRDFT